jgi:hypothetical protein
MILSRRMLSLAVVSLVTLALAGAAVGQPAQPPKPKKYLVTLRYHIPSPRDQHVALYREMMAHLKKLDFDFDPMLRELERELEKELQIKGVKLKELPATDQEDRGKNMLKGYVAGDKALKCLENRSVASLLLVPDDYPLPEDASQYVKVRLELYSGFTPERSFTLANQVRALLKQFDFIEATGYDHHGYTGRPFTRLVGWIPVEHLQTLLKDLRTQPSGWFTPRIEKQTLPPPVSVVNPVLVTEVLPDPEVAPPKAKAGGEAPLFLEKLSPGLRALIEGGGKPGEVVRAEIFLAVTPAPGDDSYRKLLLDTAPRLFVEGRLGQMVTVLMPISFAGKLAALPQVSAIRLAQVAPVDVDPALKFAGDNSKALQASGLAALHNKGFKGKGVRIGIIDSDFRGYQEQVKAGKLPASTRLVDLTTETSFEVEPYPYPKDGRTLGHGTHCALAAALAAPEADFTLIRIDPTSLPQLEFVMRVIKGEAALSEHLLAQIADLQALAKALDGFRDELARERVAIMQKYEDETDIRREYEILGVVRGWLFSDREWHFHRVAELERYRAELAVLEKRFARFLEEVRSLKGIQIVSTSLTWNSGYPLGGASPLSRWFDEDEDHKVLFFVSVGNTAGQTWTGQYRDVDANGVMEFLPTGAKLPPETWTPELAFLAWQPHTGERTLELPEGARVRVTLQWREPHDPAYFFRVDEPDRYLRPLADLRLVALYQRDPGAKVLPADDFEVVGRSPLLPQRLDNQPNGATYQQVVEFTVAKAGRYALRVERMLPRQWLLEEAPEPADSPLGRPLLIELTGLTSTGIRPAGAPALIGQETQWELQPRLFVELMDGASAGKGRVVLRDFNTAQGSIPMLADTRTLVAVGAAAFSGQAQPYSTRGAPGTLSYFLKPNVLAFDSLQLTPEDAGAAYGASVSTPFAAGMAATLLSAGRTRATLCDYFFAPNGRLLRVPSK